jgi:hypothetical protein
MFAIFRIIFVFDELGYRLGAVVACKWIRNRKKIEGGGRQANVAQENQREHQESDLVLGL